MDAEKSGPRRKVPDLLGASGASWCSGRLVQKIGEPTSSGCADVAGGKRVARDERKRNRVGDDREDVGAPQAIAK